MKKITMLLVAMVLVFSSCDMLLSLGEPSDNLRVEIIDSDDYYDGTGVAILVDYTNDLPDREITKVVVNMTATMDTSWGSERLSFTITKGSDDINTIWLSPGETKQEWEVLAYGYYWLDYAKINKVDIHYSDGTIENWNWSGDLYYAQGVTIYG